MANVENTAIEVVDEESPQEVQAEETLDPIAQAEANAAEIIKNAQRKESIAQEELRKVQALRKQLEEQQAQSAGADEDSDLSEAERFVLDILERKEKERQEKEHQQKLTNAIEDFVHDKQVTEAEMNAIFQYWEENSITPTTPRAVKSALNKAHKQLFAKEESKLEQAKKQGEVLKVTKKAPVIKDDNKPLSERTDLSFAEKRRLIWKKG